MKPLSFSIPKTLLTNLFKCVKIYSEMIFMKKCEYCAKELESYHLQYCKDTDCEKLALEFYDKRRSREKIFGIINIVCISFIMIGLILAVFKPVPGNIIVAITLLILGFTVLAMPFAPENFYQKYRIQKTTRMVRILGLVLLVASFGFGVLALYYFTH